VTELSGRVEKRLFHDVDVLIKVGAVVSGCVFVRCSVEMESETRVEYCNFMSYEMGPLFEMPEHVVCN